MTADVAEAEGLHQLKLSGTKFRKMLRAGEDIPEWCGLLLTQSTKDPEDQEQGRVLNLPWEFLSMLDLCAFLCLVLSCPFTWVWDI